jgi:hypothetical protein
MCSELVHADNNIKANARLGSTIGLVSLSIAGLGVGVLSSIQANKYSREAEDLKHVYYEYSSTAEERMHLRKRWQESYDLSSFHSRNAKLGIYVSIPAALLVFPVRYLLRDK